MKTLEKMNGNEWAKINEDCTWEYQSDVEDEESYISGIIILDDDERTVIDYDGCYELPEMVLNLLEDAEYYIDL